MDFTTFLKSFLGDTVEVVVGSTTYEGTLVHVTDVALRVEEPPVTYGPNAFVDIQDSSIDYVRIPA